MEVEDPISAKFRTLIETLMAKTTAEIVKVFVDVLLETRIEISRSWKEIDELRNDLQQRDQRTEQMYHNQTTQITFKNEENDFINTIIYTPFTQEDKSQEEPQTLVSCTSVAEPSTTDSQMPENPPDIREMQTIPEAVTSDNPTPDTTDDASTSNILKTNSKNTEVQISEKQKKGRASKNNAVTTTECESDVTDTKAETPNISSPADSLQEPSTSTGIIIINKTSEGKGAVLKKKYMQRNVSSVRCNTTPHMLRGRERLSQRPCLCCVSDQCSTPQALPKNSPRVHTCRYCGANFKERTEFKSHTCTFKCKSCGKIFNTLETLKNHNKDAHPTSFPYRCYPCGQMFATLCGWNMHKRIHANSQQIVLTSLCSNPVPTEFKAKVEVRLERISEAQLEAAMSPKSCLSSQSSLPPNRSTAEPMASTGNADTSSTQTVLNAPLLKDTESQNKTKAPKDCQDSVSGIGLDEPVGKSDFGAEDLVTSVIPPEVHSVVKRTPSKSLTLRKVDRMECDEGPSGANEALAKGLNSRKRKISDCSHDVYNGVFPVEKILKWRNTKGQNEVRIKWMPCSLCGAKWKNTWEPAESFISFKDD